MYVPLLLHIALLVLSCGTQARRLPSLRESDYHPQDVIERDFLVLGGGASGTYAAVRLKDHGKSVALIERENFLGGHTYTYIDPASGNTSDIGVVIYQNFTTTINWFRRFDIPLTIYAGFDSYVDKYVDFAAGVAVPDFKLPNYTAGFQKYFQSLTQWPNLQYGFNLTYPVSDDLVKPFGNYVSKYALEDAAFQIHLYSQSQGNILDQTALYVFKYFGVTDGQAAATGFLGTAHHNNSEVYWKAQQFLGADTVMLNSRIVRLRRSDTGVFAVVSTPSGYKLIKASRLVSSIPPQLNNLGGWDLTTQETALFGQFNSSAYWTALVTDTGLSNDIGYTNVQPASPYSIPRLPQAYDITPTGSIKDVFHIYYGGPKVLPDDQVRQSMIADVNLLQKLQGVPVKEPTFLTYMPHNPFQCTVTPELIQDRFYERLYSLQGKKSTFWTGAAWHTHDSALLWRFTEALLPIFLGGSQ